MIIEARELEAVFKDMPNNAGYSKVNIPHLNNNGEQAVFPDYVSHPSKSPFSERLTFFTRRLAEKIEDAVIG